MQDAIKSIGELGVSQIFEDIKALTMECHTKEKSQLESSATMQPRRIEEVDDKIICESSTTKYYDSLEFPEEMHLLDNDISTQSLGLSKLGPILFLEWYPEKLEVKSLIAEGQDIFEFFEENRSSEIELIVSALRIQKPKPLLFLKLYLEVAREANVGLKVTTISRSLYYVRLKLPIKISHNLMEAFMPKKNQGDKHRS